MNVKLGRDQEPVEVKIISVAIGDSRFRISESIDGNLVINKTSYSDKSGAGLIWVNPRSGNEVEVK